MTKKEMMTVIMLEIVAPTVEPKNIMTTAEDRDEILRRYKEVASVQNTEGIRKNWAYVFAPIKEVDYRDRLIGLFNYLNKESGE